MVEYELRFNNEHVVQLLKRYRKANRTKGIRVALKVFLLACLLLLSGICISGEIYEIAGIFIILIVLLFIGPIVDIWLLLRQIKKSPFYNEDLLIRVSGEGYSCQGKFTDVKVGWRGFTNIRKFKDGILLFSGPTQTIWLPDKKIKTGSKQEVYDLFKENAFNQKQA